MTGTEVTNLTVSSSDAQQINYGSNQQNADLMNLGPGTLYVSWRKAAVTGDSECLRLPSGSSYEVRPKAPWQTLSVISDTDNTLFQAVIR